MKFLLWPLVLIIFTTNVHAFNNTPSISFDKNEKSIELKGNYYVLKEQSSTPLTIENVYDRYLNDDPSWFYEKEIINRFSDNAIWYKFSVKNNSSFPIEKVIHFNSGSTLAVDLYHLNKENFTHTHSSSIIAPKQRVLNQRKPSFPIKLAAGEQQTFFIRVKTYYINSPKIIIQDMDLIEEYEHDYTLLVLLFQGLMLCITLYNLFIFASTRDLSTLSYIYMTVVILIMASLVGDFAFIYNSHLNEFSNRLMPFFRPQIVISSLLFTYHFLQLKETKRLKKLYFYLIIFSCIPAVIALTPWFYKTGKICSLLEMASTITAIVVGAIRLKQGFKPAKYFILAMLSLACTGFIFFLTYNFNVLKANFFSNNVVMLGTAIESILFAFALADKFNYNIAKEFRKRTKAENELKNINTQLENLVQERTQKLISSNQKAALGSFAAGIVHELNSPLAAIELNAFSALKQLEKEEVNKEKIKRSLDRINNSIKKSVIITDGLSFFSKDFDKEKFEKVRINDLMNQVETFCIDHLHVKENFIIKHNCSEDTYFYCQKNALAKVLVTLIRSQSEFSEIKDEMPYFDLYIDEHPTSYRLIATINKPYEIDILLNVINNPFTVVAGVERGSGIEFSLIHGIMKGHNGEIEGAITLEKNLRVVLTLPKKRPKDQKDEQVKDKLS